MIEIEALREYYKQDKIFITEHAAVRFRERKIRARDIRYAVNNGEIIEQYHDDFPYPSCLILGKTGDGLFLHIVMSDEGNSGRIITAYYPEKTKWSKDFKVRKVGE